MYKLANQVIDAYDDVTRDGLRKLASVNPKAQIMSSEEHSKLADHNFALCMITKKAHKLNKFPIDSADNTWLSSQFFDMNAHKLPKTAAAVAAHFIKRACEKFHVKPSSGVEKLAAAQVSSNICFENEAYGARPQSVVATFDKLAEVQQIGDNYTQAQYAMPNSQMVKAAGLYFEKFASKMPLEYRHKYAAAIQRRALELGMPVQGGVVAKYASDSYSGLVDVQLRARAQLLDGADPKFQAGLSKLASMRKERAPAEFAQALAYFDKVAGLSRYYGSALEDPYRATFSSCPDPNPGRVKTASGKELGRDELAALANGKYDKVKAYFGQHVADEFKKDPSSIFESLPNDAKEIMVNIAQDNA